MARSPALCLLAVTLVAAHLVCAGISLAQSSLLLEENGIDLYGESQFLDDARALSAGYPEAREKIETALGWRLHGRPRILLLGNRETFRQITGNPLVTALAVPGESLIVIFLSPATGNPYVLQETFIHELCHLLLHEHLEDFSLPRWLDEGICQWVSGSLGEIAAGDGLDTSELVVARHPIPLAILEDRFPDSGEPLLRAYAQSRSIVEYVIAQYGKAGLQRILHVLKEGRRVDQAIPQALGIPLQQLEEEWLRRIRGRNVWIIWATQHLYDILFFAGAVLTIMASVRLWARKRRRHTEDDEHHDGFHPHGGDLS